MLRQLQRYQHVNPCRYVTSRMANSLIYYRPLTSIRSITNSSTISHVIRYTTTLPCRSITTTTAATTTTTPLLARMNHSIGNTSYNRMLPLMYRRQLSSYHDTPSRSSIPIAGPIVFAVVMATVSFGVAGMVYEQRRVSLIQRARAWLHKDRPSLAEVIQVQQVMLIEKTRAQLDRIRQLDAVPDAVKRVYYTLMNKWYSTSPNERFLAGIIGINTVVFLAWQLPMLAPWMARHFMHYPGISRSYTLLTACFSHKEIWHFGFNMMALWSFGQAVLGWMSREEFTAFYLTAGTLASLGSHVLTARFKPLAMVNPSLGASGAIFGLFASCAWKYPDAQVHMIFLPMLPIKIGHGLAGLMALDLVGALRGWRVFDHYAHLSGAISGLLYMQYGHTAIWDGIQRQLIAARRSN